MTTPGPSWAARASLVAYVEGLAAGAVEALAPGRREEDACLPHG